MTLTNQDALVDEMNGLAADRTATRLERRKFLSSLGAVGAVTGVAAMTGSLAGCANDGQIYVSTPTTTPSVVDVLNFALNLEYLEASFYSYVTTGAGLPAADLGPTPGTVTGGAQVQFVNPVISSLATQLATDEREHVEFLLSTIASIGGTPISLPSLNLAANGAVTTDATFVTAARQLETVGVSAYIGGAQYLTTSAAALTYAAQILDTEAQHEGFMRELCIQMGITSPAVDALDTPPSATAVFNTSTTTGLNPVRTTSQVLQIVYGTPGVVGTAKGGFFPNGLNGTITTS